MGIKTLGQKGFTDAQVKSVLSLRSGIRVDEVRYELWGATGKLRDLNNVFMSGTGSVEHVALGEIHSGFRAQMVKTPLALQSYFQTVLKDKPQIYLRMNDLVSGAGQPVADVSGFGRHGVQTANGIQVKQNSLLTDVNDDFSFRFTGVSYVQVAANASFDILDKGSFEFIIQTTSAVQQEVFHYPGKIQLLLLADGRLAFNCNVQGNVFLQFFTQSPVNDGNKYHCRFQRDGSKWRFYIDASLQWEVTDARPFMSTPGSVLAIGGNLQGSLDEFALYNYGLTEYQGRLHYQAAFRKTDQVFFGMDEVKVFYGFYMPDGQLAEFALGVFVLTIPDEQHDENIDLIDVIGFDRLIYLIEDTFATRYFIPAGTNVVQAVTTIIQSTGLTAVNIQPSNEVTTKDIEFAINYSKKKACNELLKMIGYSALTADEHGVITSGKYQSPGERPVDWTYKTDQLTLIMPQRAIKRDFTKIPNEVVGYTGSLEQPALISVKRNVNAKSVTSVPNRRRTIRKVQQFEATTQAVLDTLVQRELDESQQKNIQADYSTVINPIHTHLNKIRVEDAILNSFEDYIETRWKITFPGPNSAGSMEHEFRKTVDLSEDEG